MVARGLDDVVQASRLGAAGEDDLVVAVDRVGAQPGVEAVEAVGALGEVGHEATEQLRPQHERLEHRAAGDLRRAVRVPCRARPQPCPGRARLPGRLGELGPQRRRQGGVERRVREAGDSSAALTERRARVSSRKTCEPSGSVVSPGSTNPIIRPFASMPFESTWPRMRSWSADATVFGSSGKNVTPVKPSARSSSSRAASRPRAPGARPRSASRARRSPRAGPRSRAR